MVAWSDDILENLTVHFIEREKRLTLVLFKSLRNCKRRNKGNFTSKSNSNKIMLCRGGGQHYLFFNKISTL